MVRAVVILFIYSWWLELSTVYILLVRAVVVLFIYSWWFEL